MHQTGANLREDLMNRFFVLTALALSASACSGTSDVNLNNTDSGDGQDAAVVVDASVQDVTTQDVTVIEDAHVVDSKVVDVAVDTYVGPADSKIQCGTGSCSAQKEICCWHQGSTLKPYECVSNPSSCAGTYDVTVTCSSQDNCASQGNPSYTCCATGGNYGSGSCYGYDIASVVACKATCTGTDDSQIGCDVKTQNCADSLQTCMVSKCTDPGVPICL